MDTGTSARVRPALGITFQQLHSNLLTSSSRIRFKPPPQLSAIHSKVQYTHGTNVIRQWAVSEPQWSHAMKSAPPVTLPIFRQASGVKGKANDNAPLGPPPGIRRNDVVPCRRLPRADQRWDFGSRRSSRPAGLRTAGLSRPRPAVDARLLGLE